MNNIQIGKVCDTPQIVKNVILHRLEKNVILHMLTVCQTLNNEKNDIVNLQKYAITILKPVVHRGK